MPRGSLQLTEQSEGQLLLLLARLSPEPPALTRAGELLTSVDWNVFRALARRHGVTPLVYRSLTTHFVHSTPEQVLSELRTEFHRNARVNLARVVELKRLLRVFASAEIPVMVLKGPAVAEMAYGDPGLRSYGDLDILVTRDTLVRAERLMNENGYTSLWLLTPQQERAMVRHGYHHNLRSGDGSSPVELHWQAIDACFTFAVPDAELWRRKVAVQLGSDPVDTLSPEDQVLFLCLHGAKHFWSSLRLVCDVAEIVNHFPRLDWKSLTLRAAASGAETALRLGLRLADELLAARLPEDLRTVVRSDPAVSRLMRDAREFLALKEPEGISVARMTAFHLRLFPTFVAKVRYLSASAAPKELDVLTFPLPASLTSLYLILRPIRLLFRLSPSTEPKRRNAKLTSEDLPTS